MDGYFDGPWPGADEWSFLQLLCALSASQAIGAALTLAYIRYGKRLPEVSLFANGIMFEFEKPFSLMPKSPIPPQSTSPTAREGDGEFPLSRQLFPSAKKRNVSFANEQGPRPISYRRKQAKRVIKVPEDAREGEKEECFCWKCLMHRGEVPLLQ